MITKIKEALRNGDVSIGSWMQLPNSSVAEIMSQAGYAWVSVDLEHGAFSRQVLPDIFRSLESGGTVPIARVASAHPTDIKQALDSGARGVILPMIETGNQLEEAVSSAMYPPKGTRGVGYCRANLFGKNFEENNANGQDILIVAQIEHIRALQNLENILSVKGINAIMVGPYDLSASMGLTAQFKNPLFLNALEEIKQLSKQYEVPIGYHVVQPDKALLQSKIAEGYQFIAYGMDAIFLAHAAQLSKSNMIVAG